MKTATNLLDAVGDGAHTANRCSDSQQLGQNIRDAVDEIKSVRGNDSYDIDTLKIGDTLQQDNKPYKVTDVGSKGNQKSARYIPIEK